jgi:hypothetical protein
MTLFDLLPKRNSSLPIRQICYDIAYSLLPGFAYSDFRSLNGICHAMPSKVAEFFYDRACRRYGIEPDSATARGFKWHTGKFEDGRSHLTLEYPLPAPFDLSAGSRDDVAAMMEAAILAPYYSCVVRDTDGTVSCYVLGQAPQNESVTVRGVFPDGSHCRLWSLAAPSLSEFHESLGEEHVRRFLSDK